MKYVNQIPDNTPALGVVADRDFAGAEDALRELWGELAAGMLKIHPIVVALASTPERIRMRKPYLISVRKRKDLALAVQMACQLVEGPCAWMMLCDTETRNTAARALQLDAAA
jgi:hypothetical protein